MFAEPGHFIRPDVGRHDISLRVIARDLATDMPELFQVVMLRAFRRFDTERRVTARAAATDHVVPLFHNLRQREECLEVFIRGIGQGVGDAVPANARETPFAISLGQLSYEGGAIFRTGRMGEATDIEAGDAHQDALVDVNWRP